jgi:hypothetical protein
MLNRHLIPDFLSELYDYAPMTERRLRKKYGYDNVSFDFDSDEADFLLESLFEELDEVASRLPYCYFGGHRGDSADYGFWLLEDWQDDDDLLTWCDDSRNPTRKELSGYSCYCRVNDHGNITLYNHAHREVWAIV